MTKYTDMKTAIEFEIEQPIDAGSEYYQNYDVESIAHELFLINNGIITVNPEIDEKDFWDIVSDNPYMFELTVSYSEEDEVNNPHNAISWSLDRTGRNSEVIDSGIFETPIDTSEMKNIPDEMTEIIQKLSKYNFENSQSYSDFYNYSLTEFWNVEMKWWDN